MRNDKGAAVWRMTALGLLLAGCATSNDPDPMNAPRAGSSAGPPPSLNDAYWAVATLNNSLATCPDLTSKDWLRIGTHMFSDATPGLFHQEYAPVELPEALRRFCYYRWTGATGMPVLPAHPDIGHASFDQAVVEGMGNGLEAAYRPALRDVFRAQAGALEQGSLTGTDSVFVAVVDSESEFAEMPPRLDHGSAMAEIIMDLACTDPASCPIESYHALALPLLETGHITHDGGYYGTRGHVAMGIVESVLAWRNAIDDGEQSRLVINLSLGWVTAGNGACGTNEAEPWCESGQSHASEFEHWIYSNDPLAFADQVSDEAVHAALLYATCQGALVVASAGNAKDESCNDDPVAPGIWSRYAAPSEAECTLLGFEPPTEYTVTDLYDSDRAFVQPVSAIDHYDDPIFVTRPGSQTRLAAPGYFSTTGEHMDPLTGTSVSAAVVSAGAALLWSLDPERTPGEVVDRLYGTGTSLGRDWEQLEPGEFPAEDQVMKVSLCRAADPDCESGTACVAKYCAPEDTSASRLADLRNEVEIQVTQINPSTFTTPTLYTDSCMSCGETISAMMPSSTGSEDYYFFSSCGATTHSYVPVEGPTLAGPQPDDPPCPDCPLVSSPNEDETKAILALDDWYWPQNIDGMTLTLRRQGQGSTVIDLSSNQALLQSLQMGQTVSLALPGIWHTSGSPLRKASFGVHFWIGQNRYFRSNEMLVIPPS